MAKKPAPVANPTKAIEAEVKSRLLDARAQKDDVELDLREGYFFTKPRLSRTVSSDRRPDERRNDESELQTSIGTEVNEDFATEIISAFLQPHVNWCKSGRTENVPEEVWNAVKDQVAKDDEEIFNAIKASNFYAELSTALIPDCGLGTFALWISDPTPHRPIQVLHVPIRELEINLGPWGTIDDRFVVRHVKAGKVQAVVPGKTLPPKIAKKAKEQPDEWVEVVWAYWRDWTKPLDIIWKYACCIGGELVEQQEYKGAGSCPLIVVRFSPDSVHAWGNGPTLDALPDLRVLDVLTESQTNRADRSLEPAFAYPDDGLLNFEDGGIEAGRGYPRRPGPGNEVQSLEFQSDVDLGLFTMRDKERAVRRRHFADYPDQEGKTPPTATQWIDEMVKSQRRIGTPGGKFFHEGPAEFFLRFRYILEERAILKPLTQDGTAISIRPENPATRAQEQQDVQVAIRVLEIGNAFFPQIMPVLVDAVKTIQNIREKLGDKLVEVADPQQAQNLIEEVLRLGGQAMGAGMPQPGAQQ